MAVYQVHSFEWHNLITGKQNCSLSWFYLLFTVLNWLCIRSQEELEHLNQASEEINRLELQLDVSFSLVSVTSRAIMQMPSLLSSIIYLL